MTDAELLLDEYHKIIGMECPSEEECESAGDNEFACFDKYPIHMLASVDGRVVSIMADLDGATPLLLAAAFRLAASYLRGGANHQAAIDLSILANEIQGV